MNYPNGIQKKTISHNTSYGNRGMNLENDLNVTNEFYRNTDKAYIYKKPTPIKIVHVNYESRNLAEIDKAFFTEPSTTDYNGIYKGKYIDFEAKETRSKTSFHLDNIHKHQIKHLNNIVNHGGIAFLIVRFVNLDQTYLLKAIDLFKFIDTYKRKSIPLTYFQENGYIIKTKINPRVDYLEIVDKVYGGILWKKIQEELPVLTKIRKRKT